MTKEGTPGGVLTKVYCSTCATPRYIKLARGDFEIAIQCAVCGEEKTHTTERVADPCIPGGCETCFSRAHRRARRAIVREE